MYTSLSLPAPIPPRVIFVTRALILFPVRTSPFLVRYLCRSLLSLSLSRSTVASFSIRLLPVCFYLRRRSLFFQASFKDTCLLGYLWLLYFDHRDTVSRFDRLFVKEFSKGKLSSDVIGSLFILFFLNRVNQDGLFNSEIY